MGGLRNHGKQPSRLLGAEGPQLRVTAVTPRNPDAPSLVLPEPKQHVDQGTLPSACRAGNAVPASRRRLHAQTVQNPGKLPRVAELQALDDKVQRRKGTGLSPRG